MRKSKIGKVVSILIIIPRNRLQTVRRAAAQAAPISPPPAQSCITPKWL